ncbi:TetR/AcrR family transcriptional regulator [Streptomyces sp. A7024]|uniref:TetR/AcrR family transcriptional regulator n=1 Tax=Streptomyces coryli TaxID=1128680 RepID=A0A6G4U6H4_9ACTN|nr:TetR/AcrR family transcriptional regulator [Streptomyces coryli]NGN67839.1 TetR/AcrR family transcriptional regulator [Streptomyces coryli]
MTTEHSGSGDLNKSMALLWDVQERGTRGPKPGLTLARIVAAAIEVADAEGLDAVSMRRVATELGVSTMSLYRHVPGKGELLDLMLDRVSEIDPEKRAAAWSGEHGWREVIEAMARGTWEHYLAHPWLLQVDQARPILGPNSLTSFELALAGLTDAPLSGKQKVMAITAVDAMVSGIARTHVNSMQAEARTGVSDEEFWQAQTPALEAAQASGCYPEVFALDPDSFSAKGLEQLEFALRVLLDGLAPIMEGPGGATSGA